MVKVPRGKNLVVLGLFFTRDSPARPGRLVLLMLLLLLVLVLLLLLHQGLTKASIVLEVGSNCRLVVLLLLLLLLLLLKVVLLLLLLVLLVGDVVVVHDSRTEPALNACGQVSLIGWKGVEGKKREWSVWSVEVCVKESVREGR